MEQKEENRTFRTACSKEAAAGGSSCLLLALPAALLTHLCASFLDVPTLFTRLAPCSHHTHAVIAHRAAPQETAGVLQRQLLQRHIDAALADAYLLTDDGPVAQAEEAGGEAVEAEERTLLQALLSMEEDASPSEGAPAASAAGTAAAAIAGSASHLASLSTFPPVSQLHLWFNADDDPAILGMAPGAVPGVVAPAPAPAAAAAAPPAPTHYDLLRQLHPLAGLLGHWRACEVADAVRWPLGRFVTVHWDAASRRLVAVDRVVPLPSQLEPQHGQDDPALHQPPLAHRILQIRLAPFAGREARVEVAHVRVSDSDPPGTVLEWVPARVSLGGGRQRLELQPAEAAAQQVLLDPHLFFTIPTFALRTARNQLPMHFPLQLTRIPVPQPQRDWTRFVPQLPPVLKGVWQRARSRVDSSFFVPPPPLPRPGLFTAMYGGHGPELFLLRYSIVDGRKLQVLQSQSAEEMPADEDEEEHVPSGSVSESSGTGVASPPPHLMLRAVKILGDVNVPAGKSSWRMLVAPWANVQRQIAEHAQTVLAAAEPVASGHRADQPGSIRPLDAISPSPPPPPPHAIAPLSNSSSHAAAASDGLPVPPPESAAAAAAGTAPAEEEGAASDGEEADEEQEDEDEDEEDARLSAAQWGPRLRALHGKGLIAGAGHAAPRLIPAGVDVHRNGVLRLRFLGPPKPVLPFDCPCSLHAVA